MKATVKFSAEELKQKISDGIIREEYGIMLLPGFNSSYHVDAAGSATGKGKTGEEVQYNKYRFTRDGSGGRIIFETQLFQALVVPARANLPKSSLKVKGCPLWFSDELENIAGIRKFSDVRDDDGGLSIWNEYEVIGAAVFRSKMDTTRWSVNWRHYSRGHEFVAALQSRTPDKEIKGITEAKMLSMASAAREDRLWTDAKGVERLLPDAEQLDIDGDYAINPQWAPHVLILREW